MNRTFKSKSSSRHNDHSGTPTKYKPSRDSASPIRHHKSDPTLDPSSKKPKKNFDKSYNKSPSKKPTTYDLSSSESSPTRSPKTKSAHSNSKRPASSNPDFLEFAHSPPRDPKDSDIEIIFKKLKTSKSEPTRDSRDPQPGLTLPETRKEAPWVSKETHRVGNTLVRFHNEVVDFVSYVSPPDDEHEKREKAFKR
jgi:hypothetical protein